MQDKTLYQQILGLKAPWSVTDVQLDVTGGRVVVRVSRGPGPHPCPECQAPCPTHDHRTRQWRHLDTCQLTTLLEAEVPRVRCADHGVHQVHVPWAEPGSGFTALFEAIVLGWLREASISAVACLLRLSWDEVDGIMERGVRRGRARQAAVPIRAMGIDETSYQKRHEYVTVIVDRDRNVVADVIDDRTKEGLHSWLMARPEGHLEAIQTLTMDMWAPYINAAIAAVPGAEAKICFDRFHVSQHFGKALDQVRAQEHRELRRVLGDSPLTRTKHDWLRNAGRIDNRGRRDFMALTRTNLRTARAWAMKETAAALWAYRYRGSAAKAWKRLLGWISRCQLKPVERVGRMVREHLWGILNAVIARATNAASEAKNARIQRVKAMACGFRSRARFKRAILFHLGGLDVMPQAAYAGFTHTDS